MVCNLKWLTWNKLALCLFCRKILLSSLTAARAEQFYKWGGGPFQIHIRPHAHQSCEREQSANLPFASETPWQVLLQKLKKRLISINFWRLFASCSKTHWVTSIVCTKQLSTQFVIKVRQSVANWTLVVLSNHNHQQLFLKDFHITL